MPFWERGRRVIVVYGGGRRASGEYLDTGVDLWNLCTDNAPGHNYLSLGMSTAYFDMMRAAGYRSAGTGVNREQARDVVLKYLSDHPGMRNMPASELALTSLKTAFQCVAPAQIASRAKPAPRTGKPKGPVVLTPNR